jgi:hypothetical protein
MADEDDDGPHWSFGCAGCGGIVLFFALMFFGIALYNSSRFDPDERCPDGERGECIRTDNGRVEQQSGFFHGVRVSYDDGRFRADATMIGSDEPPVGTRIRLEWWDGKLIALYDPGRERRYKTTAWPSRWDPAALGFLVLALPFFIPLLVYGLVRLRRR